MTADNVIDGEFDTQGWNRFMYTHGNPIRYKDPTGHLLDMLFPTKVADSDYENKQLEKIKSEGKSITPTSYNEKGIYITDSFPNRANNPKQWHGGIDIRCQDKDVAKSIESGKIIRAGCDKNGNTYVTIRGDISKLDVTYVHIGPKSGGPPKFDIGQKVKKGTILGYANEEGQVKGKHLHITVRDSEKKGKDNTVDPVKYITDYNPESKFIFDKGNKNVETYYQKHNPETYQKMKDRIIRREEE